MSATQVKIKLEHSKQLKKSQWEAIQGTPQYATMVMNVFAVDAERLAQGYINFWSIKEAMIKWCEQNCSNFWYCDYNNRLLMHFLSKNDMFLFKLHFAGNTIEV